MAIQGEVGDGPSVAPFGLSYDSAGSVQVADPEVLFLGDYSRQGHDLLIEHGGNSFLVQDYFAGAGGNLVAPNGAFLTPALVEALAGPVAPGQYAQAGTEPAATALAEIGKVVSVSGTATATHSDGVTVDLATGDPVYQGDVVRTGADSKLGISFIDDSVFSLSADARMVLNELVFDPAKVADSSMVVNLVQGSFVFVTGQVAPAGNMKVETPVATMGIRGTTPKVLIDTNLGVTEFSILPDPGSGKIGSYLLIDKTSGEILGTVESVGDKWVITSLSDEAVKVAKSGLDLLEDERALADIRDAVSNALGKRAEYDGSSSFQQVAFDSSASAGSPGDGPGGPNNGGGPGGGDGGVVDPTPDKDDPPIAGDDAFSTHEDAVLIGGNVINASGGGADVDPDGFTLTVTQVNGEALTFVGGTASVPLPVNALHQTVGANLLISQNGGITYDPTDAFNYLAVGETETDTFTYTVTDQFGYTDTASVTVTIQGRNDVPAITMATNPVSPIAESAGDSSAQNIAPVTGTITVIDPDYSDTLTLSVTGNATAKFNGGAVPVENSIDISALIASGAISFGAVGTSEGASHTVNWTYDPAAADLDWLRVGDTLTLTYVAQIHDGHVTVGSQTLVITITGTNDFPFIDGATNPGPIAESAGDSSTQNIALVTGTITVSDVSDQDVGDTLTLSVTGNATAAYNGGAIPVENSIDISALIASGAIGFGTLGPSNGESQVVNWTYDPAAADLDWLREGDTLTLTYIAQIDDGHGNVDTEPLVITITGTNDVPVITGATNPAAIAEGAGDNSAQNIPQVDGTITITDQDLGDTMTLSVTGNATAAFTPSGGVAGTVPVENSVNVSALIASGAISFDAFTSDGETQTVGWHYDPAAADLDWLGEGDTLTLTYVARINDGHGNVGSQNLVITITGTNDVPAITGATNPAAIAEGAGDSSAQNIPQADGTITVTDQDVGDTMTLSVTGNATATYTPDGGVAGAVPIENSISVAALIASGAISFDAFASDGETQTVGWHYDPAAADLDWLGEGDTLTLTYVAQVNDGHGNIGSQNLVITITGTNDVPAIDAATNPAAIAEGDGDSSAQNISAVTGTITVTDQDVGDTMSLSVTGNATATFTPDGGTEGALPLGASSIAALIDSGAISFASLGTSDGETKTVNWTYDPAAADLDWLGEGDTLTLTYVAQVDDGHGNVDPQNLVITITGTNDVPTIDAATNPAAIAESAGDSSAQNIPQVDGTITITDQDVGDTMTLSVTGNATASYTPDGGAAGALPAGASSIAALIASGAVTFDAFTSDGGQQEVGWHYNPAAADLDWLGEGDTLTLTYVAQVDDGHGNVGSQNLVITITGTNDVPTIDAAFNPAAIAESDGDSSAQNIPQVDGTITITDQDVGDAMSLSVTGDATALYNGGAVPAEYSAGIAALIASGAISFDAFTSDGGQQVVDWHYNPAAANLDWLGEGDTLTLTYVAQVDDGHGNVGSQDLVITITGTNDAPVAVASEVEAVEDTAQSFVAADFGFSDPVDGTDDALQAVIITGLPGHGTLLFDGLAVEIGQSILASDLTGNRLSYLAEEDYSGEDTFTFKVRDDAGGNDTSVDSATMTINVEPVADDPLVQVIGHVPVEQPVADGPQTTVNTTTVSEQESPSIAALDDGGYVIAWQSFDGTSFNIVAQRYDASGAPDGDEIPVNTTTAGMQEIASVAALSDGGFVVAWASSGGQDGSGYGVYGQRFDASGAPDGSEFRINTYTTGHQAEVSLTGLADGGFLATWTSADQDGAEGGIYAQRYEADGDAVGSEFRVNSTTADDQRFPQAAALPDGGFVVAWNSDGQDGSGIGAFFRIYDENGVAVTGDVQANTFETDNQRFVDLAVLSEGNFVVIWQSDAQSGELADIYGQLFDATGAPVGDEFSVNTVTASNQTFPTVTALQDGGFIVSWLSNETGAIKAQRFGADGDPVGVEFSVSESYVNGLPIPQADSATLSDGSFVVTWHMGSVDGDGDAVVQRHFLVEGTGPATSISGVEDTPLLLDIQTELADQDGSETISSIVVSGLPAGYSLSAGTEADPGVWTLAEADLPGLTIVPPQDESGSFQLQIDITSQEIGGDTATSTQTLDVIFEPVNDAPEVEAGAELTYYRTDAAKIIDAGLTADDVDDIQLIGATVAIGDGFVAGEDELGFVGQSGISGSYDDQTGILTLSGVASLADYQAALRSVTYVNLETETNTNGAREIAFTVDDGVDESVAATSTVYVSNAALREGDEGPNTLTGDGYPDDIYGFGGADQLIGGAGDDWLFGGDGSDTLTGGDGPDRFFFLAGESGVDTITDFDTGDDFIDLQSLLSGDFDPETPQAEIMLIEAAPGSDDSILQVNAGTHAVPIWANVAVLEDVGFSDTINIIYDQNHEAISFANTSV